MITQCYDSYLGIHAVAIAVAIAIAICWCVKI